MAAEGYLYECVSVISETETEIQSTTNKRFQQMISTN